MNLDSFPFYKKARKIWADTQINQIVKGLHKYEEPFNPHSWTADELLNHAMEESVDLVHYIVGLRDLVKAKDAEISHVKMENERLKRELEVVRTSLPDRSFKVTYYDLDDM